MEVDNLRVFDQRTSAIPEPSIPLLLAVGIVGLVVAKRWRTTR
jgi:hypothetical protein